MMMRYVSLLLVTLTASSSAFTTNMHSISRVGPLNVAAASMDWDDEAFLMQYAQDCASSDSCSLEDAKKCLDNVIRIQSDCISGSLLGSSVCEDVDVAAELVAKLREKVDLESKRLSVVTIANTAVNVSLVTLFLAAAMTGMSHTNPDIAPITMQEWWWSVRDGYLPLMLKEYYQNGGLAEAQPDASSFTMQELFSSVRDGYFPLLLKEYFTNGGLAGSDLSSSDAFTPQEWSHAIQGGYLDQMISQTFSYGGLTEVQEVDTLPITPQEWVWAAQGGYLDTLLKSYFEKGGL